MGFGDCADLGRLYFIWPNAIGVRNDAATAARTIRVIIGDLVWINRKPKRIFGFPGNCKANFRPDQSFVERNRKALRITETELKLIAAPAIIGLSRIPKNG